MVRRVFVLIGMMVAVLPVVALERSEVTFKIFQFPPNMIPRIDGEIDDWSMVPEAYAIGIDQLMDTEGGKGTSFDKEDLDVRVRVGWVKGLNRLYFLYEAYDNYWDFALPGLKQDIFEVVVDADLSGGPLIDQFHRDVWTEEAVGVARTKPDPRFTREDLNWLTHGVHAQNYHIFTPAENKDWAMAWGCAPYKKKLPYANSAQKYDFKPGESGRYVLEFWITPFDYSPCDGPQRAVESRLEEDKLIAMSWCAIDYDDVDSRQRTFWNLSHKQTFFGNADYLVGFRLMPIEPRFRKPIEAQWTFHVVDLDRRLVAFKDTSVGEITSWKWDFGDGSTSAEQHPIHQYERGRDYVVVLSVEGPAGASHQSKVWDVTVK